MALDTGAALAALVALVGALPGLSAGAVVVGIPKALDKRLSAFVALGGGEPFDKTTGGQIERRPRFLVTFGYRVGGDPGPAEAALADAVDALVAAIYADRTLGGACDSARIVGVPDDIVYRALVAQEFRLLRRGGRRPSSGRRSDRAREAMVAKIKARYKGKDGEFYEGIPRC
jgi:hypothetical protein